MANPNSPFLSRLAAGARTWVKNWSRERVAAALNALAACLFWLIAIGLVFLWILGYREAWESGNRGFALCSAFLVPVGLFLLFWLEGMEAAYGELREVEPEQVEDAEVRQVLEDMQHYDAQFIGQREFFVVVGILIISLLTDFDFHFLKLLSFTAPIAKYFGLIFTSLIVFWFASVASKKLALRNPQKFLRYCSALWPLIRRPSWTVYLAPADSVADYFAARDAFRESKTLSPSRISYYEQSFKRYGYASHRFDAIIRIGDLGTCTIIEKGLLWVIQGERKEFKGSLSADARLDDPQFKFARLLKGPRWTGENTNQVFGAMDLLFDSAVDEKFHTATDIDLPRQITELGISFLSQKPIAKSFHKKNEQGHELDKEVAVHLESPVLLPEGLRRPPGDHGGIAKSQGALLLYCLECRGDAGAFNLNGKDSFGHSLTVPCGKYTVTLQLGEKLNRQFGVPTFKVMLDGTENKAEWGRVKPGITEHEVYSLKLEAQHPLPGANIVLEWACLPKN